MLGSKKVKLRRACDECSFSKVRCSGDENGCVRCRDTGLECVYGESRVGKVPGVRAQRNRGPASSTAAGAARRRPSTAATSSSDVAPAVQSPAPSQTIHVADGSFDDHSPTWLLDFPPRPARSSSTVEDDMSTFFTSPFPLAMESASGVAARPNPMLLSPSTSGRSQASSGGDFDLELLDPFRPASSARGPYAATATTTANAASPRRPLSGAASASAAGTDPRAEARTESQSVTIYCAIISHLEKWLRAPTIEFGAVLGSIRRVISTMGKLIASQRTHMSPRCQHLCVAVIYQMVELLERAYLSYVKGSTTNAEPGAILNSGDMESIISDFVFDGLLVDPQEQHSLRGRLVLRELLQVREVYQRLMTIGGLRATEAMGSGPAQPDLARQLEALILHVKAVADA